MAAVIQAKPTTIYLVRHGQTEWNIEQRMQGHRDSPLTANGILQAQWLGESLRGDKLDAVYTSSSGRAVQTAKLIAADRDVAIRQSDALREIGLGVWEGVRQSEVKERDPEGFRRFWEDPASFAVEGGESYAQVRRRAEVELRRIVTAHPGESVLIVTHTVVVKLLMAGFEGRSLTDLWGPPYIHPTCLCKIELDGECARILLHGDTSHYREEPQEG